MKYNEENLKQNLPKIFLRVGKTRAQFCRETGVAPATICHILKGNSYGLTMGSMTKILNAYPELTFDDLAGRSEVAQ